MTTGSAVVVTAAVALAWRRWERNGGSECGVSAAATAAAAWRWGPAWQPGNGGGGMATMEAALQAVTGTAQWRRWHSCGSSSGSNDSQMTLVVVITRQRRSAWQSGGSAASLVSASRWEVQREHSGVGSTHNQQSSKRATATATKKAMMKAMMMTMETKRMAATCHCLP